MLKFSNSILIVIYATLCISCTSFQYATINSSLHEPDIDGFTYSNDTLDINYTFAGENCPLRLNIYNKADCPLYINWNQSAIIINGESFPLNPFKASHYTQYSEVSTKFHYNTYTSGSSSGQIIHNDRSGFIPPKAGLNLNEINICSSFLSTVHAQKQSKKQVTSNNGQASNITEYEFSKEASPLQFRCYLSYSTEPDKEWNCIDTEFWVASIFKVTDLRMADNGSQFYITKSTGAGTALGVVALVGLTAIAVNNDNSDLHDEY